MPELTVLEMQLPQQDRLEIGKLSRNPDGIEIGDREAQFVAENVKNLTYLRIGKQ